MDPVGNGTGTPEMKDHSSTQDTHNVTSWVSVTYKGPWKVEKRSIQTFHTNSSVGADGSCLNIDQPRMGSLCQVRVCLKADLDEGGASGEELPARSDHPATELTGLHCIPIACSASSVLQVPLGDWTTLRLGEGQCDIIEACVEGMRAEETCEILFSSLENTQEEGKLHLCATVELQSFTPGKESWQMSSSEKWEWVRSHKERGRVRFRSGDVWGAADSYSRALKLVIPLQSHVTEVKTNEKERPVEEQRMIKSSDGTHKQPTDAGIPTANEYKTIKAELHSNLSLCQLKLNQPERARANAVKATQLDPSGAKAWYRLGQACHTVNDLDEARRAFRRLLELQPDSPAAIKALKDVTSKEKETNAQLGQRLSKMFS